MAEPQALAAILAATCIALNYRATGTWRRDAFWIALLIAAAFLGKEVIGSLGAVVFLVALCWNRVAGEPLIGRRHLALAGALLLVVLAEVVLLLTVRPGAAPARTVLAAPCDRYNPTMALDAPGPVYVSYSYGCGRLPNPTLRIVSEFTWRDWHNFAAVHDTMTLDLAGRAVWEMIHGPVNSK